MPKPKKMIVVEEDATTIQKFEKMVKDYFANIGVHPPGWPAEYEIVEIVRVSKGKQKIIREE